GAFDQAEHDRSEADSAAPPGRSPAPIARGTRARKRNLAIEQVRPSLISENWLSMAAVITVSIVLSAVIGQAGPPPVSAALCLAAMAGPLLGPPFRKIE